MKTIFVCTLLSFFIATSAVAQTVDDPLSDCTLEDEGDYCLQNGLLGVCVESAPNGCPDPNAECSGTALCELGYCDALIESPCEINYTGDRIAGVCRRQCDVNPDASCEQTFCDPGPEPKEGCSTVASHPAPGALLPLLGIFVFLRRRGRN